MPIDEITDIEVLRALAKKGRVKINNEKTVDYDYVAEEMVAKGYRKEADVAKEIFEKLYANIKFDGHTVSVWKNDLIEVAKEYGISLE